MIRSRTLFLVSTFALAGGGFAIWAASAASVRSAPTKEAHAAAPTTAPAPAPQPALEPYRAELLDLAFRTATALPPRPHVKTRSRLQESVVEACLELDQPARAIAFVEGIDNWRRGLGHGEIAGYCARHGDEAQALEHLEQAKREADEVARRAASGEDASEFESAQDWQRDRIRVSIARAYLWLGRAEEAGASVQGVVESETGRLLEAQATLGEPGDLDAQLAALGPRISTGDLDAVKNVLLVYVRLLDQRYADAEARARIEQAIREGWAKTPPTLRFETLEDLVRVALDHGDTAWARELAGEARQVVDALAGPPQERIALLARVAVLRVRAGDVDQARAEAADALARFGTERDRIVDIERAGVLRSIAEAHLALGDAPRALEIYKHAVEEGVGNQNSRPRVEDLCATCLSMALHGVEPDRALKERMDEVFRTLGEPW